MFKKLFNWQQPRRNSVSAGQRSREILTESDHVRVDYAPTASISLRGVAFLFSIFDADNLKAESGLGISHALLESGFDVITFNVHKPEHFSAINYESFRRIEDCLKRNGLEKTLRIGLGSAVGAYTAIKLSLPLKLKSVLAISPEFPDQRKQAPESPEQAINAAAFAKLDTSQLNPVCRYIFAHDPSTADEASLTRFRGLIGHRSFTGVRLNFCGSPLTRYFAESPGAFSSLLESIALGHEPTARSLRGHRTRSVTYLRNLSATAESHNHFELSLRLIDRAIGIEGNNAELHGIRSVMLYKLGRLDEAISAASNASALAPKVARYPFHQAQFLTRAGRLDDALKAINQTLKLNGKAPAHHRQKSLVLSLMGHHDAAVAAAEEACALSSSDASLIYNLAEVMVRARLNSRGLETIDKAISIDAKNALYHRLRSTLLNRLGRYDEAIEAAKSAVKSSPSDPRMQRHLADLLAKSN